MILYPNQARFYLSWNLNFLFIFYSVFSTALPFFKSAFHNPSWYYFNNFNYLNKSIHPTEKFSPIKFIDCFLLYCLGLISAFSAFQDVSVITVSATVIADILLTTLVSTYFSLLIQKSWNQIKYSLYLKNWIKL